MSVPCPFSASAETLTQLADTPSQSSFTTHDRDTNTFDLEPTGVKRLSGQRYVAVNDRIHRVNNMAYYSVIAGPVAYIDRALLPLFKSDAGTS